MSKLTNFKSAEIKNAQNVEGESWGCGFRRRRRFNRFSNWSFSRTYSNNNGVHTYTFNAQNSNGNGYSCTRTFTQTANGWNMSWNCN